MKNWLVFIDSSEEFQEVNHFLDENGDVYSIIYYVIEGPIKCREGRVIGQQNEILLAISFYTYERTPIREMMEKKIITNSDNVIRLTDLDPSEVSPEDDYDADSYIKKGKPFITEKKLNKYLDRNKIEITRFGSNKS